MKFIVTRKVEVEIKYVHMTLPVRYGDDDMPYDFPYRSGDMWRVTIDIDDGYIINWPVGMEDCTVDMKVCDSGTYVLKDAENNEIASLVEEYVPNELIPGSYGDYVELQIDANGRITNWPKNPSVEEFFPQ